MPIPLPSRRMACATRPGCLLCLTLLVATACSCRRPTSGDDLRQSADRSAWQEITDDLGRTVAVPAPPRRIVSLAPAITEMLFAIGAGELVVGVTTFDDYPPEVRELPKVGGFAGESLSLERILELRPDLVLSGGSLQQATVQELERLNVTAVAIEPSTLDEMLLAIQRLGQLTQKQPAAKRLCDRLRTQLDELQRSTTARPRVFYLLWDQPLRTATPSSFIGELLERAGGINIFGDLTEPYPLVSEEAVVERVPDLIIAPDREGLVAKLQSLEQWRQMEAVQQGRIALVDEDLLSRPGPRVVEGLQQLVEAIHGDSAAAQERSAEETPSDTIRSQSGESTCDDGELDDS